MIEKLKGLYKQYRELIAYVIVGGMTTAVNLAVYWLDKEILGISRDPNVVIAWIASVIFAYFTNALIVFRSKNTGRIKEFLRFVSSRLASLALELVLMKVCNDFIGLGEWLSKYIVAVAVIVANYVLSKLWVFAKRETGTKKMGSAEDKGVILTKSWVVCALAFVCCALWGSAFPCVKIGYSLFEISASHVASQVLFAGVRFTLAGVMTVIIASIGQKRLVYPKNAGEVRGVFKLCLFQTVIQYIFFYIGLARTDGVKSSIIEASNVFVAILIAALVFKIEKLTAVKVIGCIVGFAGVVLINLGSGGFDASMSLLGEGCIFLSTFSYAISSVVMKSYSQKYDTVMMSGWQFLLGGVILTLAGLAFGGGLPVVSSQGLAMLFYLAFVSAAAYSLWAVLLKYNSVSRVCVYGFMNPICGVLLSTLLLNERGSFGLKGLVSLALVCIGIYIVNRQEAKLC